MVLHYLKFVNYVFIAKLDMPCNICQASVHLEEAQTVKHFQIKYGKFYYLQWHEAPVEILLSLIRNILQQLTQTSLHYDESLVPLNIPVLSLKRERSCNVFVC